MFDHHIRRINFQLPTGWNECTTPQLESIARIIIADTLLQDALHPFDPLEVKVEVFLALTDLEVLAVEADGDTYGEHTTFTVCFRHGDDRKPFELTAWQVHSFCEEHLGWLDVYTDLQRFPYPTYGRDYGRWQWHRVAIGDIALPLWYPLPRTIEGPAPMLDGMSWQQYRFCNDWLEAYTTVENYLLRHHSLPAARRRELRRQSDDARCQFLASLFGMPVGHCPRRLRRMPPERFQLCLIWWQSMIYDLSHHYRRCFKAGRAPAGSTARRQTPIELYTRSTATLQKYLGLSEDEINSQPCRVILQHLDDMAREAEEMEKLNKKRKK